MENDLVQKHVEHWVNEYPELATSFNHKLIKSMLLGCEILTKHHPRRHNLVYDFVSGLVMIFVSFKNNNEENELLGKEGDKRTKPVFDLFLQTAHSETFQLKMIDSGITGEEVIKVGEVHIPITEKTLLKFLSQQKRFVYGREDLKKMVQDFKIDRIDFFQPDEAKSDQIKPKNRFTAKEMGHILFYLLETTNQFPYTKDKPTLAIYASKIDKGATYSPQNLYAKGFNPLRKFNEGKEWVNSKGLDIGAIEKIIPFLKKYSEDAVKLAKDNIHEIAEIRSDNLD
jgi:hypothetical protein